MRQSWIMPLHARILARARIEGDVESSRIAPFGFKKDFNALFDSVDDRIQTNDASLANLGFECDA